MVTYAPDSAGRTLSADRQRQRHQLRHRRNLRPGQRAYRLHQRQQRNFAGITNASAITSALQPLTMSATAPSQTVFSIGYDFHAGNGTAGSGTDNGNVFGITNYKDTHAQSDVHL